MHIVVTGGLGHIGSHFIRELPQVFPGADITIIDNLSTQRYCSLFNLSDNGNYRFIEADVLTADLASLFANSDVVVHLAAVTDAANSFNNTEHVEKTNFIGTERVARACAETGSGLVFLSTTSVYGTQKEVVDENCPPSDLKPQSPYAVAKLKAERLLQETGAARGLRFIICRFGTIFGTSAGMRFHTAINKFCWQAVMEQPITVWRTALHQRRPYLDLADASAALIAIIENGWFDGEIYNVLTTNATVNEILQLISSEIPNLAVEYVDSEIMNQLSYAVLNDRFRSLGFEFRGSLERGIRDTIALLNHSKFGRTNGKSVRGRHEDSSKELEFECDRA